MNPSAANLGRAALSSPGRAAISSGVAGAVAVLSSFPRQATRFFERRFPVVAVTGMTGVGKTRLVDRLARRTTAEEHLDVGSATMERRTRRASRMHGFRFRVVPGDNAATRLGALDDIFHEHPVDGVLHVVANGHATPRRPAGTTGVAEASREIQLAAELEDWAITAHRIASLAVRREEPLWLLIVVTKSDLFPDGIDEAIRYYSPGSGSPFGNKIDELRTLAGGARLSVDVLAVSSVDPTGKSALANRSDAMLAKLVTRMTQLSGHV